MKRKTYLPLLSLLAVFFTVGCGLFSKETSVDGAGATFPAPLYSKWASDYNKISGLKINYQAVGSGAGIRQIDGKVVSFGASDMPLSDEELQDKGLVQFPTVIGGVVPVVNIEGIKPGQLKLTGQILGDIYLGTITRWNDPAIQEINPTLNLPNTNIVPVRRAEGSGTTFIFTNYLSKAHNTWNDTIGEGAAVNWPVGAGGKGNEGVAAFVNTQANAIGYVEYAYASLNNMTYTQLQNAAGNFVAPNAETFKAAAADARWNESFNQLLTHQNGDNAWPISGATFILMHKKQDKPKEAAAVLTFFDWTYTHGDDAANTLDYVPLPANVKNIVRASWKDIQDSDGKPIHYAPAAAK